MYEAATEAQINRLAALGLLEERTYSLDEARYLLMMAELEGLQPNWKLSDSKEELRAHVLKISMQAELAFLKKPQNTKTEEAKEHIEEIKVWLKEVKEEERSLKEEERFRISYLQESVYEMHSFDMRKPTLAQIRECVGVLDETMPGWEWVDPEESNKPLDRFSDKPFSQFTDEEIAQYSEWLDERRADKYKRPDEILAEMLLKRFPKLDKSVPLPRKPRTKPKPTPATKSVKAEAVKSDSAGCLGAIVAGSLLIGTLCASAIWMLG